MIKKLLPAAIVPMVALTTQLGGAGAPPPPAFDMAPLSEERLTQPLPIDGCPLTIVEWKTSSSQPSTTSRSPEALAYIGRLCKTALEKYPQFVESRYDYHVPRLLKASVHATASILPANVLLDGKQYRNLNDFAYRFSTVKEGGWLWGYYHYRMRHVFLRNDILAQSSAQLASNSGGPISTTCPHEMFRRTFLHEMAHVLNHQWGLLETKLGNRVDSDEHVANEFVTWLGLDSNAGSSADALPARARCEGH
jgi:hypothetical protein